jgi:thiamine-monophosphate kinase
VLVREIGEFGLIDRISAMLPEHGAGVIKGIGDDVAVLDTSGPEYLLATCDIQVEGVHFLREAITAYQLGRKVAAINVSDIAAAGGEPRWGLVSLAVPGEMEVEYVEELYRGMREQMQSAGASIAGGNLSRMQSIVVVDFTLLGVVAPERLILRSTARVGDAILLTGRSGESRAGLELIRRPELAVSSSTRQRLIERHLCPQPRLAEGRVLARSGLVTARLDVSDGVIGDLSHICTASGRGAEIETSAVEISPELRQAAREAGAEPLEWALTGGEDYELLFTAAPEAVAKLQRRVLEETGTVCAQIGRITEGTGVSARFAEGARRVWATGGWDHFGG